MPTSMETALAGWGTERAGDSRRLGPRAIHFRDGPGRASDARDLAVSFPAVKMSMVVDPADRLAVAAIGFRHNHFLTVAARIGVLVRTHYIERIRLSRRSEPDAELIDESWNQPQ